MFFLESKDTDLLDFIEDYETWMLNYVCNWICCFIDLCENYMHFPLIQGLYITPLHDFHLVFIYLLVYISHMVLQFWIKTKHYKY